MRRTKDEHSCEGYYDTMTTTRRALRQLYIYEEEK